MDIEDNKTVWIIIGGALLAALVLGVILIYNSGQRNNGGSSQLGRQVDIEIKQEDWTKGKEEAPITLVEYGDFQCPACKAYRSVVSKLKKDFGDKLRIVFRHYPLLKTHKNAMAAAKAAEAAGKQGKFWEMHDKLFKKQKEWGPTAKPLQIFMVYSRDLDIDTAQFRKDFKSKEVTNKIKEDISSGKKIGISGTPSFVLNGKILQSLPQSYKEFKEIIQKELNNKTSGNKKIKKEGEAVHKHADLAVYINGRKINLSKSKYQSTQKDHKHKYVHLHDGNGKIIHQHRTNVTLGEFFESLGMKFTDKCFQLDNGEKYCTNQNKTLKFFVNGERSTEYGEYEFKDLDEILISYGPTVDPNIKYQLSQVSNKACIYSKECPERGTPPEESCVTGLGTKCGENGNSNTSTAS